MRVMIATDFDGQLRKLIWFTENKTGVSAGICDSKANPHVTYHVDGTYHHKITHRGGTLKIEAPKKKVPLASISTKQQLLGTVVFYADHNMKDLPRFTPDGRVDTIVILGQSIFSNIRCASFNSYIFHRDHEAAFMAEAYALYEDKSFTLVTVNAFSLHQFPKHKVGVVVYKGRGEIAQIETALA